MSIIRVDKSAGRWEAVPVALTNDARLSLEARGLAAWFMTRPPNWRIRAGALSGLLAVGRDKVKRLLRELEDAGYLVRARSHDPDGRWVWESTFSPTPAIDVFSVDGRAVDGGAGDGRPGDGRTGDGGATDGPPAAGKPVDISKTRGTTRLRSTTETNPEEEGTASSASLRYPKVLTEGLLDSSVRCMKECPEAMRQAVLDEVAAMAERSLIRGRAIGLLRTLVIAAKRGTFVPSAGIAFRRRNGSETDPRSTPQDTPAVRMTDAEREEVKKKLTALRNSLAASAVAVPKTKNFSSATASPQPPHFQPARPRTES